MIIFEKELKDQLRNKNITHNYHRAMSQQQDSRPPIVIIPNKNEEDDYRVISPITNKQMFPQPPSAMIQEDMALMEKNQVYSMHGTEDSAQASPVSQHHMKSTEKDLLHVEIESKQRVRNLQNLLTESLKLQQEHRNSSCGSNFENKSKMSHKKSQQSTGEVSQV